MRDVPNREGCGDFCWEEPCYSPVGSAGVTGLIQGQERAAVESWGVVRDIGAVLHLLFGLRCGKCGL